MAPTERADSEHSRSGRLGGWLGRRGAWLLLVGAVALSGVPAASAHGTASTSILARWHGLAGLLVGIGIVAATVAAKRTAVVRPTTAIYGVLLGLTVTTVGALIFDGLAPEASYSASTMPFPRSWYYDMTLVAGMGIAVLSFVIGWLRWPTRPRYTFLGILIGLWVAYPSLLPGVASTTNPLGYLLVLVTPVLVGYVLWRDTRQTLRVVLRDAVARRFGIGVGLLLAVYFTALSGYMSFFPDEAAPHERVVEVVDVQYQLVVWPTLEIFLPHVPFFLAISVGSVVVVGLLSVLVGLNGALIAYQWRTAGVAPAATIEGTGGPAAIVGSCACGCCGPILAQFAVLVAGSSVAAPIYWVFVDSNSPFAMLFLVASIALFTASLVYATNEAPEPGEGSTDERSEAPA